MDRSSFLPILGKLFAALLLVLVVAAASLTQPGDVKSKAAKKDSSSEKEARRAAMIAARGADTTTGWLILNGELIPAPYDIVVEDNCVKINGLPKFGRPEPPEPSEDMEIDSNIVAQHVATRTALDSFHASVPRVGVEAARQLALEFLLAQAIVDTAYLTGSSVRVLFHGMSSMGGIFLQAIGPRYEPKLKHSPEEQREQLLEKEAHYLKSWLNHGHLVIIQKDGGLLSMGPPGAKATLIKLQEIATSIPDLKARTAAVRKIISDTDMADAIAEKFMQD